MDFPNLPTQYKLETEPQHQVFKIQKNWNQSPKTILQTIYICFTKPNKQYSGHYVGNVSAANA